MEAERVVELFRRAGPLAAESLFTVLRDLEPTLSQAPEWRSLSP